MRSNQTQQHLQRLDRLEASVADINGKMSKLFELLTANQEQHPESQNTTQWKPPQDKNSHTFPIGQPEPDLAPQHTTGTG